MIPHALPRFASILAPLYDVSETSINSANLVSIPCLASVPRFVFYTDEAVTEFFSEHPAIAVVLKLRLGLLVGEICYSFSYLLLIFIT